MDIDLDSQYVAMIPSAPHEAVEAEKRALSGKRRKFRWGTNADRVLVPGLPKFLDPDALTLEQMDALAMRVRIEELTHKLVTNDLEMGVEERGRSPSPEPIYDPDGKRLNTRDIRLREKLSIERHHIIADAQQICPVFRPPPDYRPVSIKKSRRLFIPQDKYPDYNFIGLIIGPRGKTHRELEQTTGCKIAIRGKGASRGRHDGRPQDGEDEPLHVMITADTDRQLQMAVKKVAKFLVPVDEDKNEHKKNQLRELALINGTLRDQNWLSTVDTEERTWQPPQVKCDHCGEASHPSVDCPFKGTEIEAEYQKQKAKLDEAYTSFLDEVGVEAKEAPVAKAQADYDSFMADLDGLAGGASSSSSAPPPPPPQQHAAAAAYNAPPPQQAAWQQQQQQQQPQHGSYQQAPPPPPQQHWQQQQYQQQPPQQHYQQQQQQHYGGAQQQQNYSAVPPPPPQQSRFGQQANYQQQQQPSYTQSYNQGASTSSGQRRAPLPPQKAAWKQDAQTRPSNNHNNNNNNYNNNNPPPTNPNEPAPWANRGGVPPWERGRR